MINISEEKFNELKKQGYYFPIESSINIENVDPISIYLTLKSKNKCLFETGLNKITQDSCSLIAESPYMIIKSIKEEITQEVITTNENSEIITKISKINGNIFDYLKEKLNIKYTQLNVKNYFTGGAIGYLSYDTVKLNENIPEKNKDDMNLPDSYLIFYKYFYCYSHKTKKLSLIYNVFPEDTESYSQILLKISYLSKKLQYIVEPMRLMESEGRVEFNSNLAKHEYENIVKKAKKYIKEGDIFQVVLSQRLKFKSVSKSFDVYRRLRKKNPSPYLFYIDCEEFQISGSSPETLVSLKDNIVSTNPIAGTRSRGKNKDEDDRNKVILLNDEKERAEHLMLVDLGRNDIGKISDFGSVKVDKFMDIEYYSHVMHIVSTVSGKLKNEYNALDALKSCLPVGTVSGAPKVRAMEIIEELENVKRGIYAGAIGYFSFNGNMDTCIAIRTVVFKDDHAYVQAGAGIVYDSNPEAEYFETLNKAMALKEVL